MSCPACEEARRKGKRFCGKCGARLIEETPDAAKKPSAAGTVRAPEPEAAPSQWKADMPPAEQSPSQWDGVQAPASDPKDETSKPSQWKDDAPAPAAAAAPEPTPKKKSNTAVIAIIAGVLVLAAAAGLYFSGVFTRQKPAAASGASGAQTQEQEQTKSKSIYSLEETKLCDNDVMRVTLTEVYENPYAVSFKLHMENVSDDTRVLRACPSTINDCDMESFLLEGDTRLGGGESADITIKIDKNLLHRFGMEQIDKITFHTGARDSFDSTEMHGEAFVDVYPTGLSESTFSAPKAMQFDTQETIYQKNGVCAWLAEPESHEGLINAYTVILGAENDSGSNLVLSLENIKVNGVAYDFPFETVSRSGHAVYLNVWIMGEELARMGIAPKEVETIAFTFAVYDGKTMEIVDAIDYTYTP